jgi:serine/threonine protein kinase/tetratricopeptide (TPR) repeat protein
MLGEVIHGYRVDRALSVDKGGMGDVFFATHVESGAEAVVKVLKPEMSSRRDIVTRFFNEARAAASIHHPGIVQIHNVGYHADRAYLLMERLRGDDLENRLRAGPIPLDRAIVFMRQATGAIAAAHERGIVHRDLKPANLFVVPDPDVVGGERIKVLDFGIAKLSLDTGGNKTQGIFGTPTYMSPEQCASSGDVDARSDLYALGCIFYELVTGRPPFGHGGIELVAAHLRDMPPPPRALAHWVPPAVDGVIMHLLQKHPDQRPPSAKALIDVLDRIHSTLPPGASGSMPQMPSNASHAPAGARPPVTSSTLGNAAGSMHAPTTVTRSRGWLWIGLAVLAAAGMIVAAAVVTSGGGSSGTKVAGGDVPPAVAIDAGMVAVAPIDAAGAATDEPPQPQPPPPATGDPKTLIDEGKVALFDKRYDEAISAFTRAAMLEPSPETYFDLALAHQAAGHCNDARIATQATLDADSLDSKLRDKAKKLLKTIGSCSTKPETVASNDPKPQPTTEQQPQPQPQPQPHPHPQPQPPPPDPKPQPQPDPPPATGDKAARAEAANEAGKELIFNSDFAGSAAKFREAISLNPLPKYYFNLATAQYQMGKCAEAVKNLDHILNSGAPQPLKDKAAKLKERASSC